MQSKVRSLGLVLALRGNECNFKTVKNRLLILGHDYWYRTRFNSERVLYDNLAQLVERHLEAVCVGGSIPSVVIGA